MKLKYGLYLIIFFLLHVTLLLSEQSKAQSTPTIHGNTCAVLDNAYTYQLSPAPSGNQSVQWCIDGGVILQVYGSGTPSGNSTCMAALNANTVAVKFTSGTTGALHATWGGSNQQDFSVTLTPKLFVGSIDPARKTQSISYNTIPASISCSLAQYGDCNPTFTYVWQKSYNQSDWNNLNITTQNLSFSSPLIKTTYYRRQVTLNSSTIDYSDVATVLVGSPFVVTTISPSSQDVFSDQLPGSLTGSQPASSYCSGTYSYQWEYSTDGGNNYNPVTSNGTSVNYSFSSPLSTTTIYRRKTTCSSGGISYSNEATINVYSHVTAGSLIASKTITYSIDPGFLSASNPSGGMCSAGSYTYQWYSSPDGTNFSTIANTNYSNYDPGNLTSTFYYKRTVTCGSETVSTAVIKITVNPQLFGGNLTPSNLMIATNTSPGLISAGPATGGGCSGNYTYQWQQKTNGTSYSNITGATGLNYTPGNLTTTTYFRRQVTCGIDNSYTNVATITIGSPSSYNFITQREITKPNVTTETAAKALTSTTDVKQTKQYFDGLGRPVQAVSMQASPLGKDLVIPERYDEFGREITKYLPYVSSTSDGKYKTDAYSAQYSFNNALFPNEQFYYSRTEFEASPLNKTIGSYAPGVSWTGSNKGIKINNYTNTSADAVRIWTVTDVANGFGTYATSATYTTGKLFKTITTDENNNQLIEFKDGEGKTVLKKVQLTASSDNGSGSGNSGWLCTYYIYDLYDNLRCVIQPKGVPLLEANSWNMNALNGDILDEQCFRYEYDGRNRMTMKKVPGAGEVDLIYDKRDRLVFSQDANLRANNNWTYSLYDQINRPVETGIMNYTGTLSALRSYTDAQANADQSMSGSGTNVLTTIDILNLPQWEPASTHIDYQANTGIQFLPGFESGSTADFTASIVAIPSSSFSATETVNTNPIPSSATKTALTYVYYDNYNWTSRNYSSADNSKLDAGTNMYQNTLPTATNKSIIGSVTGKRIRTIEDPANLSLGKWMESVSFYDDKFRTVQTQTTNVTGGLDVVTSLYDFSGKIFSTYINHQKLGGAPVTYRIASRLTYSNNTLLTKTEKKLNDAGSWKTISVMSYNELGQLDTKSIGTNPVITTNPLETLNYDYNIRGWLLGVNRDFSKTVSNSSNYFGFDLGYDKTTVAPTSGATLGNYTAAQYNGNITGLVWKSIGDNEIRKYDFTYDAANRLMAANFKQYSVTNSTFDLSANVDFSVSMSYDANGNIGSMNQKGLVVNTSTFIDQLSYNLIPNTNRLQNVIDGLNNPNTVLGDFRASSTYMTSLGGTKTSSAVDYSYDDNGNLTKDLNKDISAITYNFLNLPQIISVTGKGTIKYIYDAAGNKLKKIVQETGKTDKTTLYLIGTYQDEVLQFLPQEEGRIRKKDDASFVYDYFLKDHLGNVRMVLTEEQKTDTYPTLDFEGAAGSDAIKNQDAAWDNSTGGAVDVAGTRATFNMGSPGTNGTYSKLIKKSTGAIGAAKLLKVMSGDQINTAVDYYYSASTADYSNANGLSTLTTSLASVLANSSDVSASIKGGISTVNSALSINPFVTTNITTPENNNTYSLQPKAYLHVLLFNEQFVFDNVNSVVQQIGTSANAVYTITKIVQVKKNGYAYIYFSNESENLVYFDNFKLTHVRGQILEETHYYPFGLAMSGISSKALLFGNPENKIKYNGKEEQRKEFSDGSGLEWTDFGARMYDNQIGRWSVSDPSSELARNWSPYRFAFNNPISYIDADGHFEVPQTLIDKYPKVVEFLKNLSEYYGGLKNTVFNFSKDFKEAFQEYSTLQDNDIRQLLSFGDGPTLDSWDLDQFWNNGILENGETQTSDDHNKTNINLTGWTPNAANREGSGVIIIDDDVMKAFEMALTGQLSKEDAIKAINAFISTLFHESVHYGRNKSGKYNERINGSLEAGKEFEKDKRTFGKDIERYTPINLNYGKLQSNDSHYLGSYWQGLDDVKDF